MSTDDLRELQARVDKRDSKSESQQDRGAQLWRLHGLRAGFVVALLTVPVAWMGQRVHGCVCFSDVRN